ncbi:tether containing UBX domain for GLUT4, partial [Trifolium pratense]
TKANLVTRGILSEAAHHCVSDCGGVESAQHLFLSCSTFGVLWSLVSSCIGSSLVTAQTLFDHFVQFTGSTRGLRALRSFMQLIWLMLCGLYGPKEITDCSEAQQTQCIICWTRSRLFPTVG